MLGPQLLSGILEDTNCFTVKAELTKWISVMLTGVVFTLVVSSVAQSAATHCVVQRKYSDLSPEVSKSSSLLHDEPS